MHEKLKNGDPSELLAFWRYYLTREHADYDLRENADGAVLKIHSCPAIRQLEKLGLIFGDDLCAVTDCLNRALCCDSPFTIALEKTGKCSCVQTLVKYASK